MCTCAAGYCHSCKVQSQVALVALHIALRAHDLKKGIKECSRVCPGKAASLVLTSSGGDVQT